MFCKQILLLSVDIWTSSASYRMSYEDLYVDFRINGYPFYNEGIGARINFPNSSAWYALSGFDTDIPTIETAENQIQPELNRELALDFGTGDISITTEASLRFNRHDDLAEITCITKGFTIAEAYVSLTPEAESIYDDIESSYLLFSLSNEYLGVLRDEVASYCAVMVSRWTLLAQRVHPYKKIAMNLIYVFVSASMASYTSFVKDIEMGNFARLTNDATEYIFYGLESTTADIRVVMQNRATDIISVLTGQYSILDESDDSSDNVDGAGFTYLGAQKFGISCTRNGKIRVVGFFFLNSVPAQTMDCKFPKYLGFDFNSIDPFDLLQSEIEQQCGRLMHAWTVFDEALLEMYINLT